MHFRCVKETYFICIAFIFLSYLTAITNSGYEEQVLFLDFSKLIQTLKIDSAFLLITDIVSGFDLYLC